MFRLNEKTSDRLIDISLYLILITAAILIFIGANPELGYDNGGTRLFRRVMVFLTATSFFFSVRSKKSRLLAVFVAIVFNPFWSLWGNSTSAWKFAFLIALMTLGAFMFLLLKE